MSFASIFSQTMAHLLVLLVYFYRAEVEGNKIYLINYFFHGSPSLFSVMIFCGLVCYVAHWILIPHPGFELTALALEAQCL